MYEGIHLTGRDDGTVEGMRRLLFSVVADAGLLAIPERLAQEEGRALCVVLREELYIALRNFISRGFQNLERIISLREQDFEPAFAKKETTPWPMK